MAGSCDQQVPVRVRSDETEVACLLYAGQAGGREIGQQNGEEDR